MTATVTAFLTTKNSSIYLLVLLIIALTAKFWHVWYGVSQTEGIFGYKYMSSFLYAIGNEVAFLSIGLILLFAATKTLEFKKFLTRAGYCVLFVACFFIIQILYPKNVLKDLFGIRDFHPAFYYVAMIVLSISSGMLVSLFQKATIGAERRFLNIISVLFKGYYQDLEEKNLVNPHKKKEFKDYRVDLTNKVVDIEQD